VARGVRNTVGFDWNPLTKDLYFTDNGRDWLSEDFPEDKLNRLTKVGEHFGVPYLLPGQHPGRRIRLGAFLQRVHAAGGAHGSARRSTGMRFYTGSMFPAEYRNAIFVARMVLEPDQEIRWRHRRGQAARRRQRCAPLSRSSTGFLRADNSYAGRPVDVAFLKDGSMLISDDFKRRRISGFLHRRVGDATVKRHAPPALLVVLCATSLAAWPQETPQEIAPAACACLACHRAECNLRR